MNILNDLYQCAIQNVIGSLMVQKGYKSNLDYSFFGMDFDIYFVIIEV